MRRKLISMLLAVTTTLSMCMTASAATVVLHTSGKTPYIKVSMESTTDSRGIVSEPYSPVTVATRLHNESNTTTYVYPKLGINYRDTENSDMPTIYVYPLDATKEEIEADITSGGADALATLNGDNSEYDIGELFFEVGESKDVGVKIAFDKLENSNTQFDFGTGNTAEITLSAKAVEFQDYGFTYDVEEQTHELMLAGGELTVNSTIGMGGDNIIYDPYKPVPITVTAINNSNATVEANVGVTFNYEIKDSDMPTIYVYPSGTTKEEIEADVISGGKGALATLDGNNSEFNGETTELRVGEEKTENYVFALAQLKDTGSFKLGEGDNYLDVTANVTFASYSLNTTITDETVTFHKYGRENGNGLPKIFYRYRHCTFGEEISKSQAADFSALTLYDEDTVRTFRELENDPADANNPDSILLEEIKAMIDASESEKHSPVYDISLVSNKENDNVPTEGDEIAFSGSRLNAENIASSNLFDWGYQLTSTGSVYGKPGKVTNGENPMFVVLGYGSGKMPNGEMSNNKLVGIYIFELEVDKADVELKDTPFVTEVTSHSVTVEERTGYEYSIDGETWQDTGDFDELEPDKEYKMYMREKATETSNASNPTTTDFRTLGVLSACEITPIAEQTYTGDPIAPEITVTYNGRQLTSQEVVVDYANNTNVGDATATITAIGNFEGTQTLTFHINPLDISTLEMPKTETVLSYTGKEQKLAIFNNFAYGENNRHNAIVDIDYDLTYGDNVNAGEVVVEFSGKGNFTGKNTSTFTIEPTEISNAVNTKELPNVKFTGDEITPEIELVFTNGEHSETLVEGEDYDKAYTDNKHAGNAFITVTGKRNFKGTQTLNFAIDPLRIEDAEIDPIPDQEYNKQPIEPAITVKYEGKVLSAKSGADDTEYDYDVSYHNNTDVSTDENLATVYITGNGNYIGNQTVTFKIVNHDITSGGDGDGDDDFDIAISSIPTGAVSVFNTFSVVTVSFKGSPLIEGVDYTVRNNGNGSYTITGIGSFTGSRTVWDSVNIASDKNPRNTEYQGTEETDTNETETSEERVNPAPTTEAQKENEGASNDAPSVGVTIPSEPIDIETNSKNFSEFSTLQSGEAEVLDSEGSPEPTSTPDPEEKETVYFYTGNEIKPTVNIKYQGTPLVQGEDYDIEYQNNVNAGYKTGKIIITGTGGFMGERTVSFTILPRDLSQATIDAIPEETFTVEGSEPKTHTPAPHLTYQDVGGSTEDPAVVEINEGADYNTDFVNNKDAGTATVNITGTFSVEDTPCASLKDLNTLMASFGDEPKTFSSNFIGSTSTSFTIQPRNIYETTVKDSNKDPKYIYTGKEIKPIPTVTYFDMELRADTDYTLEYTDNTNQGVGVCVIHGTGNFTDSAFMTFTINQADIETANVNIPDVIYSGEEQTPEETVTFIGKSDGCEDPEELTLERTKDYTIMFFDNTNVGTAYAILTGVNNFTGQKRVDFEIKKASPAPPETPSYVVVAGDEIKITKENGEEYDVGAHGAPVEYSTDKENWQDSNIVEVEHDVFYPLYVRYKETDNYNASEAAEVEGGGGTTIFMWEDDYEGKTFDLKSVKGDNLSINGLNELGRQLHDEGELTDLVLPDNCAYLLKNYELSWATYTDDSGKRWNRSNLENGLFCGGYSSEILNSTAKSAHIGFYDLDNLKSVTFPDGFIGTTYPEFNGEENSLNWYNRHTPVESVFAECDNLQRVEYKGEVIPPKTFYNCKNLTDITLPDNLKFIGDSAFSYCGFEEINIPESVEVIGHSAFYDCKNLAEIKTPEKVDTLHAQTFEGCTNLQTANLAGITKIEAGYYNGAYAHDFNANSTFENCKSLEEVTFGEDAALVSTARDPKNVLPKRMFSNCNSLSTINNLPQNVTEIGSSAFAYCSALEEMEIPETVTKIDDHAFEECTNLNSSTGVLNIPENCTEIGSSAFRLCNGITELNMLGEVDTISSGAFTYAKNLKTVHFYGNIGYIGYNAFAGDGKILDIYIDGKIGKMNNCAFVSTYGATRHSNVYIKNLADYVNTETEYYLDGSTLYAGFPLSSDKGSLKRTLYLNDEPLEGAVSINTGAERVMPYAFVDQDDITSVTIPDTVTEIGYNSFANCDGLTEITIGNGVTSIGKGAFENTHIQKVYIKDLDAWKNIDFKDAKANPVQPDTQIFLNNHLIDLNDEEIGNGEEIKDYMYQNNMDIKNITIPEGVTRIGKNAFKGCENLESVTIESTVLTDIDDMAFYGTKIKDITLPDTVTHIGEQAFAECDELTSIHLSTALEEMENGAFKNCKLLGSVDIPQNITSIEANTFENCTSLQTVTMPATVTAIKSYAFSGCTALQTCEIPNNLEILSNCAFQNCKELENITIPSVSVIGSSAFYGCKKGFSGDITIPDGVTSIGNGAFSGIGDIGEITIPNTVTEIGANAFASNEITAFIIENDENAVAGAPWGVKVPICWTGLEMDNYFTWNNGTITGLSAYGQYLYDKDELTKIVIPDECVEIGNHAFVNLDKITEVVISDQTQTINRSAFENCTSLKTVTIGNGVTTIDSTAFNGCTDIIFIVRHTHNGILGAPWGATSETVYWAGENGDEFIKGYGIASGLSDYGKYLYDKDELTEITIDSRYYGIGDKAFENLDKLTKITVGETVNIIGEDAFSGCESALIVIKGKSEGGIEGAPWGATIFQISWQPDEMPADEDELMSEDEATLLPEEPKASATPLPEITDDTATPAPTEPTETTEPTDPTEPTDSVTDNGDKDSTEIPSEPAPDVTPNTDSKDSADEPAEDIDDKSETEPSDNANTDMDTDTETDTDVDTETDTKESVKAEDKGDIEAPETESKPEPSKAAEKSENGISESNSADTESTTESGEDSPAPKQSDIPAPSPTVDAVVPQSTFAKTEESSSKTYTEE